MSFRSQLRAVAKSRWVYTIKYKRNGDIEKFKSRFVVCGYSQRQGIDYDRAFSSTLRATTFRCICACAAGEKDPQRTELQSVWKFSLLNLLGLGTLTRIKKRTWLPIMLIMSIGIDKSIAYKYTITSDKLLDSAGVRVGVRDSRTSRSY